MWGTCDARCGNDSGLGSGVVQSTQVGLGGVLAFGDVMPVKGVGVFLGCGCWFCWWGGVGGG